jgi:subtilase family serine protease
MPIFRKDFIMHKSFHDKATALLRGTAVAVACLFGATSLTAFSQTTVEGSKPRMLAHAVRIGAAPDSQMVTIAVYLKFRNSADLDQLIDDQQNPGSPRYQKFLTPAEFHTKYAPVASDVAKVKAELARMGFTIIDAPAGGLFVTARGTVAQVKSGFHVTQDLYSVHGKTVRSHAEAPTVPDSIAPLVLHVAGLDDTKKFVKSFATNHPVKATSAHGGPNFDPPTNGGNPVPSPCNVDFLTPLAGTVTPPVYTTSVKAEFTNCGYVPAQLQQAYGADKVKSQGQGIRIGLADLYLPNTLKQDLDQYSILFNLPRITYANFQEIYPPGINGSSDDESCGPDDWAVESTLDVEAAHAMAPKADIVYLGDACNANYAVPMQVLYQAIDNGLVDIISGSFGYPEIDVESAQEEADNLELKEAASLGITVMFSSGDSADGLQPSNFGPGADVAQTSWPASSPWATAVGGTSLLLNKYGTGTKVETGWGSYVNPTYDGVVWTGPFQLEALGYEGWFFDAGAGGGTSLFWPQPSYQKGIVPESLSEHINTMDTAQINLGTPNRVVPDIAMLADPYTGFLQGETMYEYTPGTLDLGCSAIATPANAEYCTFQQGGTSVASPLFAGVVAVIDSARLTLGKPLLGFANPALYQLPVGTPGTAKPITDALPLSRPFALILDDLYPNNEGVGFAAIAVNMAPVDPYNQDTDWVLGADSKLMTTKGFDNVTGLGTPWLPGLVSALAK